MTTRTQPLKRHVLLRILLERGRAGINKFEALELYGETALPTAISELGLLDGMIIDRQTEPHTRWNGQKTHFTRYWLSADSYSAAATLLSQYERED